MIDIKFLRENPEVVKENIKKKFQDDKMVLVDEVIALDKENREIKQEVEGLRAQRNKLSKEIGGLMKQGLKEEAEQIKAQVTANSSRVDELTERERVVEEEIQTRMMRIPNIIDDSVPVGKDDSENVELERFGDPVVPDYEIPYHTDIMESFDGIDMDAAGAVAGNGFYYLLGDMARLHSAVLAYARDFMIDKGFTYCIPPYMIRSNVVTGVMSFDEMDAMMYKIEGEDLYLIGTSEHSMIGRFINRMIPEESMPQTLTSYSPCFRKEKGAHGIEERGVYRIHQFEKQEMIVICEPEESMDWYEKMWKYTVELFRSLDVPVRTLECCSGDLADLKVKSVDVEAWSPRQQKYFEVGSCSNLGDAQARRLKIRVKGKDGTHLPHTLNNTVVAPPRMLIAFLENNLNADGSISIPEALVPYMGGKTVLTPGNKD
ncbi:MAG: serine--tRNA ligase [Eubacterium sp.]|nr:serine--tRNA ligase [Eubacterium sp.]